MRVLVPAAFLGVVYVPLRQALTEVTWEVRTRDAVRRIVHEADPRAMQTALTVDRSTLAIRLLVIGTTDEARALEDSLVARVTRDVGVTPTVSVVAVPDARMLREAAAAEARAPARAPLPPLTRVRESAGTALRDLFPSEAGPMLQWTVAIDGADTARFTLRHLGPPLGAAGVALLARALARRIEAPATVEDVAIPPGWYAAGARGTAAWLDSARTLLAEVGHTDRAVGCVEGPAVGAARPPSGARSVLARLQRAAASSPGRIVFIPGPRWRVRIAPDRCDPDPPREVSPSFVSPRP